MVDGTTQVVAQQLCDSRKRVALLNFASARNPGGGFLNGAKAQEEDLCRCSALYPTLISKMEYYETNRNFESALYTDCLIYSPKVPFIKVSGAGNYLEVPFLVDVITAPAPNSRAYLKRNNDLGRLEETFRRRWENVLAVAREQKVESLLLGAWGCGAFGGDPEMASRTAKEAIRTYGYSFEKIVFAIPNTGKRSAGNFDIFKKAFR